MTENSLNHLNYFDFYQLQEGCWYEDKHYDYIDIFQDTFHLVLNNFQINLQNLTTNELKLKLIFISEELISLSKAYDITNLINLCKHIQILTINIAPDKLLELVEEALNMWQYSYQLVIDNKVSYIPEQLDLFAHYNLSNLEQEENIIQQLQNRVFEEIYESIDSSVLNYFSDEDLEEISNATTLILENV